MNSNTNTSLEATSSSGEAANKTQANMNQKQMDDLAAQLKMHAKHVVSKLPLLGAVSWLMMQQAATRHTLLSELEWRVMPPLIVEQAKLYMREDSPVAYVSWAKLSKEVAARFVTAPHQLGGGDWQSGDQVWIVDLVVPFGGAKEVIEDLRSNVFKGQAIHQLSIGEAAGPLKPMTWPAV